MFRSSPSFLLRQQTLPASSSSAPSLLLGPSRFFRHKFRCPLCFGGEKNNCVSLPFTPANKDGSAESYRQKKQWMHGYELDEHLRRCSGVHQERARDYFGLLNVKKKMIAEQNVLASSSRGRMSPSSPSRQSLSASTPSPFLTSQRFKVEMNHALSALPCTSLIDRVLLLDTTNVQYSTQIGYVSTAPSLEYMWVNAFCTQRVAVVFVHELLLQFQAPIFNALGALAEGSANVHDGVSDASAAQEMNWATRGKEWRLLGDDCFAELKHNSKRTSPPSHHQQQQHQQRRSHFASPASAPRGFELDDLDLCAEEKMAPPTHNFAPWNSVVVPTRRDPEAGDYAAFLTTRKLVQMLERDEHERAAQQQRPALRRRTNIATQVDVVTRDAELLHAVMSLAAGSSGRLNVFHSLSQWAEKVAEVSRAFGV